MGKITSVSRSCYSVRSSFKQTDMSFFYIPNVMSTLCRLSLFDINWKVGATYTLWCQSEEEQWKFCQLVVCVYVSVVVNYITLQYCSTDIANWITTTWKIQSIWKKNKGTKSIVCLTIPSPLCDDSSQSLYLSDPFTAVCVFTRNGFRNILTAKSCQPLCLVCWCQQSWGSEKQRLVQECVHQDGVGGDKLIGTVLSTFYLVTTSADFSACGKGK